MVARALVTLLVLMTMASPVIAVNDAPAKVSGSGKQPPPACSTGTSRRARARLPNRARL